ncbi:unnamed protein product, partial [Tilletia caries]
GSPSTSTSAIATGVVPTSDLPAASSGFPSISLPGGAGSTSAAPGATDVSTTGVPGVTSLLPLATTPTGAVSTSGSPSGTGAVPTPGVVSTSDVPGLSNLFPTATIPGVTTIAPS